MAALRVGSFLVKEDSRIDGFFSCSKGRTAFKVGPFFGGGVCIESGPVILKEGPFTLGLAFTPYTFLKINYSLTLFVHFCV